jgi:threonine/homoserine/homoserine lactone efflux protein
MMQNERARAWIAGTIIVGFFAVLAALMQLTLPEGVREAMLVMLGALTAALTAVISYYFGSSSGSTRKDELLAQSNSGDGS